MSLSPQSQSVIDQLFSGKSLSSGQVHLDSFDADTRLLLSVILDNTRELNSRKGDDRANFLRECYQSAKSTAPKSGIAPSSTESESDMTKVVGPKQYLLDRIICKSFRGLAPADETVEFEFSEQSNLIYGPNGSGKSSLLGAIIWLFTGEAVCDSTESSPSASVSKKSTKQDSPSKKVCDWQIVVTLPDQEITKTTEQECCVTAILTNQNSKLYLRRSLKNGLESSLDEGNSWTPCDKLSQFGIEPIDLQLSLKAPTTFGKFTVENAPDSTHVLGLLLGFHDLMDLGDLVGNVALNRTKLENNEQQQISQSWESVRAEITNLLSRLPESFGDAEEFKTLADSKKPSLSQINVAGKYISTQIDLAEQELAKLVGLEEENAADVTNLSKDLQSTLFELEKGVRDCFARFHSVELSIVFPGDDDNSSEMILASRKSEFDTFISEIELRIQERYSWWKKETASDGRAGLLLKASQHFDVDSNQCPVCMRSLDGLPVSDELVELLSIDPKLLDSIEGFFRSLMEDLDAIAPKDFKDLAKCFPKERITIDWKELKENSISHAFSPILKQFDEQITKIAEQTELPNLPEIAILPKNADAAFSRVALKLLREVENARRSFQILEWSNAHFSRTVDQLDNVVSAKSDTGKLSLLSHLSKGKMSADAIDPLADAREQLRTISKRRETLSKLESDHELLQQLREPLNKIKKIKSYAETEVNIVFGEIRDATLENWKRLYPETPSGLYPSGLVAGKGRSTNVTAFLTNGKCEVPGEFFANAGLQRAIALSFFFALLEKHTRGLAFVVMDDPILSLDDDHRESWSSDILKPRMEDFQFIIATHQQHFLENCREDFSGQQVHVLNKRRWPKRISWQPGSRLAQARELFDHNPSEVPNLLRKYCESIIATLEVYANAPFDPKGQLGNAITAYQAIPPREQLGKGTNKEIGAILLGSKVTRVLNPASHARTSPNVSEAMIRECLTQLSDCDELYKKELRRLEQTYLRSRRKCTIQTATLSFVTLPPNASWNEHVEIQCFGTTAAKHAAWEVDFTEDVTSRLVAPGSGVLVTDDSIEPVARPGQWVLLSQEDDIGSAGDIIVAKCSNGDHLLRRIWSEGDHWILQTINAVEGGPSVRIPKQEAALRRVIGVLYEPIRTFGNSSTSSLKEWTQRGDFPSDWFKALATVEVIGSSLSPIARAGQYVLIDNSEASSHKSIQNGDLAVVDSGTDGIGRVIKRVYHRDGNCILVSPNPVDPHPPLILSKSELELAKFWVVRGVLFEVADESERLGIEVQ